MRGLKSNMVHEPWRFRCVKCDSPSLRYDVGDERPKGKTYRFGGGKEASQDRGNNEVYCRSCNTKNGRMKDKKTGELVRP